MRGCCKSSERSCRAGRGATRRVETVPKTSSLPPPPLLSSRQCAAAELYPGPSATAPTLGTGPSGAPCICPIFVAQCRFYNHHVHRSAADTLASKQALVGPLRASWSKSPQPPNDVTTLPMPQDLRFRRADRLVAYVGIQVPARRKHLVRARIRSTPNLGLATLNRRP